MKTLEEQYLEKLNLETICLEKLNRILSKFNLQIVIIKVNRLNKRQYRLVYKNDTAKWLALWLSVSDMLFARQISRHITNSIFECLNSYYTASFNRLDMNKDTLSRFQDCSDAYKEIMSLRSNSLEEFLINCDLMGI